MKIDLNNVQTDHLKFRFLTNKDLDPLALFFQSKEATRFLFTSGSPDELSEKWYCHQIERYDARGDGLYVLERIADVAYIGQCGLLWQQVDGKEELEIGYHVMPQYWGNGYATEAAIACREYARENRLAKRIISIIHPQNVASVNVATKNGMSKLWHTKYKDIPVNIYGLNI